MTRYDRFMLLISRALHVGVGTTAAEVAGRAFQVALEAEHHTAQRKKMLRIYSLVDARIRRATHIYHLKLEGLIDPESECGNYIKVGSCTEEAGHV